MAEREGLGRNEFDLICGDRKQEQYDRLRLAKSYPHSQCSRRSTRATSSRPSHSGRSGPVAASLLPYARMHPEISVYQREDKARLTAPIATVHACQPRKYTSPLLDHGDSLTYWVEIVGLPRLLIRMVRSRGNKPTV